MRARDRLNDLRNNQKKIIKDYDEIIKDIEETGLLSENEKLKKEILEIKNNVKELKENYLKAQSENQNIKMSLREQILDEKLRILKISKEKLDVYFSRTFSAQENNLDFFEYQIQSKIQKLKETASKELEEEKESVNSKIEEFEHQLQEKIIKHKEKQSEAKDGIKKEIKEQMEEFAKEGVTDEIIKKRTGQNALEMKIGLNWINKIGILLILIGVGFFIYWSYDRINDYIKGSFVFLLGTAFLIFGEYFFRKKKEIFSQGLLGGGISILFASIFYSYFVLKLDIITYEIGMFNMGFVLAILVTIVALVLSIRYNSETILVLALVGGYLPFVTFSLLYGLGTDASIYTSMIYIFILNLLVLVISFRKQWYISKYVSFLLNVPSLIYLTFNCSSLAAAIVYSSVIFTMYLITILSYPIINKQKLKLPDIILLALNTFISAVIIYFLFENTGIHNYRGILALVFGLIYIGLGFLMDRIRNEEKNTILLFFITAMTFVIIIIPFQFGIHWLSMGWLVEGLLLIMYGYKKKKKLLERAGVLIFALCIIAFYYFDFRQFFMSDNSVRLFDLKYFFVTCGMLVIFIMYQIDVKKNIIPELSDKGIRIQYFKYFSIFNTLVFMFYIANNYFTKLIIDPGYLNYFSNYYRLMMNALLCLGTGFLLLKIKFLYDRVVKAIRIILYVIGDLICFILVFTYPLWRYRLYTENYGLTIFSIILLIVVNILVIANIRELIIKYIKKNNYNLEIYPVIIGLLILFNITGVLIVQFDLGKVNLLLSFTYLFIAVASIIYGFIRKYYYVRYYGLGLTVFSLGKLLIYDLRYLETSGKIIAYFGFGIVLIVISYIYQNIKNKLDKKGAVSKDAKK